MNTYFQVHDIDIQLFIINCVQVCTVHMYAYTDNWYPFPIFNLFDRGLINNTPLYIYCISEYLTSLRIKKFHESFVYGSAQLEASLADFR